MYVMAKMSTLITRDPQQVIQMARQVWAYLAGTPNHGLRFVNESDEKELNIITDAAYGDAPHGCKLLMWGGSLLLWRSGKQTVITTSTAEAELVEAMDGASAGEAVRAVIQEVMETRVRMINYTDSSAAMSIISSDSGSWRTRHLRKRAHGLRARIQQGDWMIRHIPGAEMTADLGTKVLSVERFNQLKQMMGMVTEEVEVKKKIEERKQTVSGKEELEKALKAVILVAQFMMVKGSPGENGTVEELYEETNDTDAFTWNQVLWMTLSFVMTLVVLGSVFAAMRRSVLRPEEEEERMRRLAEEVRREIAEGEEANPELTRPTLRQRGGDGERGDARNTPAQRRERRTERHRTQEGRNPSRDFEERRREDEERLLRPPQRPREGVFMDAFLITPYGKKYHSDRDCPGLRNATAMFQSVKCTDCIQANRNPEGRLWSLGCGYMLHEAATHVRPPQTVQDMRPYSPCALCIGRNA